MATITRGTIKSYDAVTHRAAVQLAGSLAVWLDSLPVSTALHAADIVAGRECGVLFFTEDDPADACVITIHHAVPAPVGGTSIKDADNDTKVQVEESADEDKIRFDTAGTERYVMANATPHHTLTGDVKIAGRGAVGGASPTVLTTAAWRVDDSTSGSGTLDGLSNTVTGLSGATAALRGVTGECTVNSGAGTLAYVRGLEFKVNHNGANTVTDLFGAQVVVSGTGPSTNRAGYYAEMAAFDTTAGLIAAYYAKLNISQASATYAAATQFKSVVTIARSTLTQLIHFEVGNATTFFGGALTTVYGFYSPNLTVGANKIPFYDGGISGNKNDTSGNRFRSNTQFGATAGQFGTGDGVVSIAPATTNPSTNPATAVILYVDAADGKLKARGSAGTITVLAVP